MNFWFDFVFVFAVAFAEEGNLMWIRKICGKMCYENYKIQFTKSSNIQQAEIRYDIEWKPSVGYMRMEPLLHAVMWFSVLCVLLAKEKAKNKTSNNRKNHSLFCVPDACVKGKKYVEFMNLSWKSECFEFKWKLLEKRTRDDERRWIGQASKEATIPQNKLKTTKNETLSHTPTQSVNSGKSNGHTFSSPHLLCIRFQPYTLSNIYLCFAKYTRSPWVRFGSVQFSS